MKDKIMRKLFLGFIQIHILHHAKKEPIFGAWMIEELQEHGYEMSPGTLYPLLHNMESNNLLKKEEKLVNGKIRKYYSITSFGIEILKEAKEKASELIDEIKD
ncbi:PadR family transcriptional regulator [Oceanirhabdus seepicola]|uniref:Helix-turn-helix transcriptional regulator n=1 Tax=Oceanirhabdus seepicola TaxID=2828781 RepID=A0A9J6NZ10_9CLOT|nr:PadR family transcriptional regulator [Oceanirhabdus seepicola]MCM1989767.1 helix-turn-helix transcriptional regulator [Oceanirhabdus seepicola]